jgi:uncharacterized protein YceK
MPRAFAGGALIVLALLGLSGCSGVMSHRDALQATLWGGIGTAAIMWLAVSSWRSDYAGARVAAAISAVLGGGLLIVTIGGVGSLLLPEAKPGAAEFQCTVRPADHHVLVTVRNVGGMAISIGTVFIQPEDANGRAQGAAVSAFLPLTVKMPPEFNPGDKRTFDVASLTTPECEITGSSAVAGTGQGSVLSNW